MIKWYYIQSELNSFSTKFMSMWKHSSVQFSCSVVSDSLWLLGLHYTRLLCPSPTPGAYLNSWSLSQWCHPTILSSVIPFTPLQSFPASGSFPMSQLFESSGQSIGASASASVLPVNIQGWCPLRLAGLISLQYKGLSRVSSSTTIQKLKFFGLQSSLWSNSHTCTWLWKNHNFYYTDLCWQSDVFAF